MHIMKHWVICITDGDDIKHYWYMSGKTRYAVLVYLMESWNKGSYDMPYSIRMSGIKKVEVLPSDMRYSVWG